MTEDEWRGVSDNLFPEAAHWVSQQPDFPFWRAPRWGTTSYVRP